MAGHGRSGSSDSGDGSAYVEEVLGWCGALCDSPSQVWRCLRSFEEFLAPPEAKVLLQRFFATAAVIL